jgi:hypothetical protein
MGPRADTPRLRLALAAGPGLLFSKPYGGYFLNYYRDAAPASARNLFLGLSAGGWPGEAQASIVAASTGLRGLRF